LEHNAPAADLVVHLAATGVFPGVEPAEVIDTNVGGTLSVLSAAARIGARRVVLAGSGFEYGEGGAVSEDALPKPRSVYAASKFAATVLAQSLAPSLGVEVVALRPFMVYGPGERADRLVPSLIDACVNGRPLDLTAGAQVRDFVHVTDVAGAFVLALTAPVAGEVVNIASGKPTSVRDVAVLVNEACGGSGQLNFGVLPYRADEVWDISGDITKAHDVLGWTPTIDLATGIANMVAAAKEQDG
jgi:nucleoside-diphosphate-sugar epimerase